MTLQRSPTLHLATAVEEARARGIDAHSLSTPQFPDRGPSIGTIPTTTLLSPAIGDDGLRARCRTVLFGKWDLADHETMVTAGAKAAVLATLRAVCTPGDRVLVIGPSWPSYADIARLLYLEPRFFETRFEDGFAIDAEALAREVDRCRARVIVLCSPGNPTGRIVSGTELEAISRVARERESVFLLDESFSGVIFDHERWKRSVCAGHERLVVVSSISKSYQLQGLRVGACLARGAMLEAILVAHQGMISSAPSLSQSVAYALLENPKTPPEYGVARQMALDAVNERGWATTPSEGSFYIFPRVAEFESFETEARARNVFLLPGETFGQSCKDHFRLCFGKSGETFGRILEALGPPKARYRVAA